MPVLEVVENKATNLIDTQYLPTATKIKCYADPTIKEDAVSPEGTDAVEFPRFGDDVLSAV